MALRFQLHDALRNVLQGQRMLLALHFHGTALRGMVAQLLPVLCRFQCDLPALAQGLQAAFRTQLLLQRLCSPCVLLLCGLHGLRGLCAGCLLLAALLLQAFSSVLELSDMAVVGCQLALVLLQLLQRSASRSALRPAVHRGMLLQPVLPFGLLLLDLRECLLNLLQRMGTQRTGLQVQQLQRLLCLLQAALQLLVLGAGLCVLLLQALAVGMAWRNGLGGGMGLQTLQLGAGVVQGLLGCGMGLLRTRDFLSRAGGLCLPLRNGVQLAQLFL